MFVGTEDQCRLFGPLKADLILWESLKAKANLLAKGVPAGPVSEVR